ncbi:hypothetical protein Zmor_004852 [Zophobas morio]|uniref:Peptidase S1 domain-containing protein n=1 Tax=Zophobas morio TaxID=2755281 RepID=A0AA38IUZ1_9CUCU|nr:hypothetical protein Zmor_004852 [Zophobas morio]
MFWATITLCLLVGASALPLDSRIVNGTDADPGDVPFIVSLRVNHRHSCGATIINEKYLLTAAHCVQNPVDRYSIQYGLTHIISGEDAPNVIKAAKLTPHENYVAGNGYVNDVAVIELEDSLPLGPYVQPTTLPPAFNATPENSVALLAGWGLPFTNGSVMTDLQKVNILVFPDADCERIHALTGPTHRSRHVCAGVPEGGKGQCNGDSGGPLIVDGVQIGIVSWSVKPCTVKGYPGVFAKVSNYVNWIKDKITS